MQQFNDYLPLKLRSSLIYGASILIIEGVWALRIISDPVLRPILGIAAFGIMCTLIIVGTDIARLPKTKGEESGFFIAQTLAAAIVILAAHRYYFDDGIPIVYPYMGLKLLALCLALATPARSVAAWICFAVIGLGPLAQSVAWNLVDHGHYDFLESAINLIFVGLSIVLWRSRLRLQQTFHRMLWLQSRANSAEKLASLLLGARHLQNSALQAIEARTSLIEFEVPESKRHTDEIQKAINQIVRLSAALEVCDTHADWSEFVPPRDQKEFELRLFDFQKGKHARMPEL